MKRTRPWLAFALATALCAAQGPAERAARLLPQAARVRGLPPPAHLKIVERSAREIAEEEGAEALADDEVEAAADRLTLHERLGLTVASAAPRSLDAFDHALRRGVVAGYYDPDERALVLVPEPNPPAPGRFLTLDWREILGPPFVDDDASTIVHEYGHALQHARAPRLFDADAAGDADVELAVRSLLEGDAVLLEAAFMLARAGVAPEFAFRAHFAAALAATFEAESMDDEDRIAAAEDYVAAAFDFPYAAGVRFAAAAARRHGGFRGIDAALDDPPLSTEQILHPEKWLGPRRDHPLAIAEPEGWSGPPGYDIVAADVLGEFGWRRRLAGRAGAQSPDFAARRQARRGAEGWGGDLCLLHRNARGSTAVSALVVLDSPRDAAEFAAALTRRLSAETSTEPTTTAAERAGTSEPIPLRFVRRGELAEGVFLLEDAVAWLSDYPRQSLFGDARRLLRESTRTPRTKLH
jgi:hypothetical protein